MFIIDDKNSGLPKAMLKLDIDAGNTKIAKNGFKSPLNFVLTGARSLLKFALIISGGILGFNVGWAIGVGLGNTGGESIISLMLALFGILIGAIIGFKISVLILKR